MNYRHSWTHIASDAFSPILGSGQTYELTRADWPLWAKNSTSFERIWVYALKPGELYPSIGTTAPMVLRLLTERLDPSDAKPYNYDWYAVVRSSSGGLYQSGPHRDIDFGHHLATPVSTSSLGPSA